MKDVYKQSRQARDIVYVDGEGERGEEFVQLVKIPKLDISCCVQHLFLPGNVTHLNSSPTVLSFQAKGLQPRKELSVNIKTQNPQ